MWWQVWENRQCSPESVLDEQNRIMLESKNELYLTELDYYTFSTFEIFSVHCVCLQIICASETGAKVKTMLRMPNDGNNKKFYKIQIELFCDFRTVDIFLYLTAFHVCCMYMSVYLDTRIDRNARNEWKPWWCHDTRSNEDNTRKMCELEFQHRRGAFFIIITYYFLFFSISRCPFHLPFFFSFNFLSFYGRATKKKENVCGNCYTQCIFQL